MKLGYDTYYWYLAHFPKLMELYQKLNVKDYSKWEVTYKPLTDELDRMIEELTCVDCTDILTKTRKQVMNPNTWQCVHLTHKLKLFMNHYEVHLK